MKKLLLLSERLPFPPTSGTKNLLYNYCRILHDELGIEVVNVSFLETEDDYTKKPKFISKVISLPDPSGKSKIKNLILETFIRRRFPLQVSLFWDPKIKVIIDQIVDDEKPDFVIADFIRTAEYLKDYKGFRIADLQDLLSLRYQRQLKVDINTINPYGAYLFRLPNPVRKILQIAVLKRLIMKTEIELLKKYEVSVGENYDRVMFVAEKECQQFDKMLGQNKAIAVPLGVDYEYFSEPLRIKKVENSIAFMGALNVAHNENGIVHFIENIFPLILKEIPQTQLFIIGGGASEAVKKYESNNVILTGRVPDVREAVATCQVFICPLQFGSGIKTKNLEAMAMGMPVVTTMIGAENIHAKNGVDWYVAENDSDFAQKVLQLLKDKKSAEYMGKSAQSYICNNFTWKLARSAFEDLLFGN